MSELIKREDVQREIQDSFDGCALGWQDWQDLMDRINALPAASPWHRVEDGLPKYGQDVLAARLYGADSDGWAYEVIIAHVCEVRGTNYWNATNVTHWMPLPEPPKEDA